MTDDAYPNTRSKKKGILFFLMKSRATKPGETYGVPGQGDTLLLSAAVDVVSDGNAPDSSSVLPECMSADRMVEVAVDLVAAEADFGAETLSGR